MRVLFGPENDRRHTPDPAPPGAYEWWYFDALSDDGRYALVAIFFLGTPMSPYYKAVVDGARPDPMDWCGVFFSLHERIGRGRWAERAYAYNLYPGGEFPAHGRECVVGGSRFVRDGGQHAGWVLSVDERALWRGRHAAELRFSAVSVPAPVPPPPPRDKGDASAHAWVCVAPHCRVEGSVVTAAGERAAFRGDGYHDHNFGTLPFSDFDRWYWARAHVACSDGAQRSVVLYRWEGRGAARTDLYVFEPDGAPLACRRGLAADPGASGRPAAPDVRGNFGLRYAAFMGADVTAAPSVGPAGNATGRDDSVRVVASAARSAHLADGPFYRRMPYTLTVTRLRHPGGDDVVWTGDGQGIGEVFVPARLCGPIASRALWTRLRRRAAP